MACKALLPRFALALAVARAGAAPDEGPPMRRLRGGAPANCSDAVLGQAGCERARELGGATGQCVARGNQCGYNGNPWCAAGNRDKCCCDFGHCAPRLGNAEGIIDMQCYPADKCVSPAEDPSQALCGAGAQQQIPCCGDAVCLPIAGSEGESGGGVLMACVRAPSTSPSTSRSTCVDWNMPCDYYSQCCDGYQCTWANTEPKPSTICLSPGGGQSGPEGSCAAWNEPCDYYNKCCESYTCTWANTDPEPSTICL